MNNHKNLKNTLFIQSTSYLKYYNQSTTHHFKMETVLSNMASYYIPCGIYLLIDELRKAWNKQDYSRCTSILDSMEMYAIPCGFIIEIGNARDAIMNVIV